MKNITKIHLTKQEAASLKLVPEPDGQDQGIVACELNESGDMVRCAGDPFTIRSAYPCPCPFCGSSKLRVGHDSAGNMSVSCGCGARLVVSGPDEFPEGIDGIEELDRYMGLQAVARWNRRSENQPLDG